MSKVLILGANGSIARQAIELFLNETDAQLTLYLRNANRMKQVDPTGSTIIEGDVMDSAKLKEALAGQDVVYANLSGDLPKYAENIVEAMETAGVKRLIFISSMGIYNEVPGEHYGSILAPYRKSAEIIESSSLDYTILRPAWFTSKNEIDYETTQKGESFKGSEVSRKSVAALVVKLAQSPEIEVRSSLGVNKPE